MMTHFLNVCLTKVDLIVVITISISLALTLAGLVGLALFQLVKTRNH